jgi:membrane protein YdbS with pleckstrin-like domain
VCLVQALSPQNRILGLVGAVEAGIALWYFTNGHWVTGSLVATTVVFLIAVYFHRERKVKQRGGRRRY